MYLGKSLGQVYKNLYSQRHRFISLDFKIQESYKKDVFKV